MTDLAMQPIDCHSEENFSPPLPVAEEGGLEFPQPHRLHKR